MFDPSYPAVIESDFPKHDWETFYKVEDEHVPHNAPKLLRLEFVIRAFVDAYHTGDKITRRTITWFIIFVNKAPIYCLSKKQSGVESSTFGSEFLTMKYVCEYVR